MSIQLSAFKYLFQMMLSNRKLFLLSTGALLWMTFPAFGQQQGQNSPIKHFYICPGDTVFITVDTNLNTTPVAYYEWYHNDSLVFTGPQPRFAARDTGTYTAVSFAVSGCSSPVSNKVLVEWRKLIAVNDEFYTTPNRTTNLPYLLNDTAACVPLDSTTTYIVSGPSNGVLMRGGTNGTFVYQPNKDFVGDDRIYYYLKDTKGLQSNVATILIHVGGSHNISGIDSHFAVAFPNPVQNYLYVKGNADSIQTIALIDANGRRRLYITKPKLDVTVIDMRQFNASVYFVQVFFKDHSSKYIEVLKTN